MQTVSISVFRFDRPGAMHWALWMMPLAMPQLRRIPDIGFFKTLGTGCGESFRPRPNLHVYGVLATWPDLATARSRVAEAEIYRRYREQAEPDWAYTLFLRTTRVRGRWAGVAPFEARPDDPGGPLAVLTRASIKPWKVFDFWRHSPDIDDQTAKEPTLLFKMGMGELPWIRQVTVSVWSDKRAMETFAYRHRFHAEAIKHARSGNWFSEELFARFRVVGSDGVWDGRDPLAEALRPPKTAVLPKKTDAGTVTTC